ncbi:MAG: folylpolyglutamate synthase/dihydrofolate synthase family protein [Ginsengibacter sp.]
MFSKTGASAYKKDITNTALLCDFIGNPQNKIKTIHIAGTNGKGSTSHMLAAIFQQCGYKTGLYTSPHLKDFRERIKIDGEMITEDFIVSFVARIKTLSEQIHPSFFELTVAMMLDYFAEQEVDIAIVETGLGGRLDSTNIITPQLSIITNIGYDHMNILGNTLEEIALEKAGIIKKDIPVVIGETLPQTRPVFLSTAQHQTSSIIFAEDQFSIYDIKLDSENLYVALKDTDTNELQNYTLDLNGIYQQNNLRTVLTALDVLCKMGYLLNNDKVHYALLHVKELNGLYGRWSVIQQQPMIVLDVAHNEDGIKQLLTQLLLCSFKNLHIVFGIVKDKEISKILSLLPQNAIYYFTKAQISRALPEEELCAKAKEFDLNGVAFPEVNMALESARKNAAKEDMILVCGSVYVIGEVDISFRNLPEFKLAAI